MQVLVRVMQMMRLQERLSVAAAGPALHLLLQMAGSWRVALQHRQLQGWDHQLPFGVDRCEQALRMPLQHRCPCGRAAEMTCRENVYTNKCKNVTSMLLQP